MRHRTKLEWVQWLYELDAAFRREWCILPLEKPTSQEAQKVVAGLIRSLNERWGRRKKR